MTVNELDSRVAVVHRCFSERGDSILSVFSWKPLRAKLQDKFLWLASQLIRSHDQPGCARAHIQPAAPRAPQFGLKSNSIQLRIQHHACNILIQGRAEEYN